MGIPRFLSRLKDANATTSKDFGHKGEQHHTRAIIDGPSFAHYVLHVLEEKLPATNTVLSPGVAYADCAAEAVKWLKMIDAFGFSIEHIFFDGALPENKKQTRFDRLAAYAVKLAAYKRVYEEKLRSCRIPIINRGNDSIWNTGELQRARKDVAPPAFLVSAVLEVLIGSEYGDRIFVVADEADRYCVAAARMACSDNTGLDVAIFANDSDLCVFDSGKRTRVIPLNDLSIRIQDGKEILSGTEVWPASIADDLRRPDLVELAFYLSKYPNQTLRECMTRVLPDQAPMLQDYPGFVELYQLGNQLEELEKLQQDEHHRGLLNGLDARVSELVYQVETHCKGGERVKLNMFLPFLFEDPTKTSAWRVGAPLRRCAYEVLLVAAECRSTTILEYKRAAEHVSAARLTDWEFQTISSRLEHCYNLLVAHIDLSSTDPYAELTPLHRWRLLVMQLTLSDFAHEGWTLPLPEEVVLVLTARLGRQWHLVHLSAQYQAAFYSLRILFQTLRYIHSSDRGCSSRIKVPGNLRRTVLLLLRQLEGLPKIADFFELDTSTMNEAETKWTSLVGTALVAADPDWRPPQDGNKVRPRKKVKRKRDTAETRTVTSVKKDEGGSRSTNPFAALAASE